MHVLSNTYNTPQLTFSLQVATLPCAAAWDASYWTCQVSESMHRHALCEISTGKGTGHLNVVHSRLSMLTK